MRDKISEQRLLLLHPTVIGYFKNFIEDAENELDITLRIVQGLRTFEEQNELYTHGRTKFYDAHGNKLGVVTNARAGASFHQYGLAVDVGILKENRIDWGFNYSLLVPFAAKYGLSWGGNFKKIKDKPHFEYSTKYNWRELLAMYNDKKFIEGTRYLDILFSFCFILFVVAERGFQIIKNIGLTLFPSIICHTIFTIKSTHFLIFFIPLYPYISL